MGERLVLAESSLRVPCHMDSTISRTDSPWVKITDKLKAMDRRGPQDDMTSRILLPDVTSLLLLSAVAEKSECVGEIDSDLQTATHSAIDMILESLVPSNVCGKRANGSSPVDRRTQSPDSMLDESQFSDYLSCEIESSSELEVFRSCESTLESKSFCTDDMQMTPTPSTRGRTALDSGVASPASFILHSPESPTRRASNLKEKMQKMKALIDDKLKTALVQREIKYSQIKDPCGPIEGIENPLINYLERKGQRNEDETTDTVEHLQKLLLDRALTSSVLITENNKLSQEVISLKKELEMLRQQSQVQTPCSFEVQIHDPACLVLSGGEDESDFGEFHSSDSANLLPTQVQPKARARNISLGDTPTTSPTNRRKIEVPSPLRAANYLSIASDDDECMSDDQTKSSTSSSSSFLCCDRIW